MTTIKAKVQCVQRKETGEPVKLCGHRVMAVESELRVLFAEERTWDEYSAEVIKKQNESALDISLIKSTRGTQFVLWGDHEMGRTFITRIDGEVL